MKLKSNRTNEPMVISTKMLFYSALLAVLFLPFIAYGAETIPAFEEMTGDLPMTNEEPAPSQWHTLLPGTSTADDVRKIGNVASEKTVDNKTIFQIPPGIGDGDTRISIPLGRVATVTCNSDGIVESINIGSFYREVRPVFEELEKELNLNFVKIASSSAYSSNSSVYKATNGYMWLIVSNIVNRDGKRAVLAMNYSSKGVKEKLPLPHGTFKR